MGLFYGSGGRLRLMGEGRYKIYEGLYGEGADMENNRANVKVKGSRGVELEDLGISNAHYTGMAGGRSNQVFRFHAFSVPIPRLVTRKT